VFPGVQDNPHLQRAAMDQHGVLHRGQLRGLGCSPALVAGQIAADRWTAVGQKVVLLQNAPPRRQQVMWIAVLDAGWPAALGSHTALELAGFRSLAREAQVLHLIVPRGHKVTRLDGVQVHESRRLASEQIVRTHGLPRTDSARSTLDAAAWQPFPRFACLMVAAAVQQRVTSPVALDHAMREVGQIRHKAYLRLAIADVAGGSESLGELDLMAVCRRFRLARPTRQSFRRDRHGRRRYLDAEWPLPTGEIVVLEIDGAHHFEVSHWQDDIRRERSIVVSGRRVLRATAFEIRLEPAAVVGDLIALGVPRSDLSEPQRAIAS